MIKTTIKYLIGKIKPYHGYAKILNSKKNNFRSGDNRENIFFSNSVGSGFWFKYFAYHVALSRMLGANAVYLWTDKSLTPELKKNCFSKWSYWFIKDKKNNILIDNIKINDCDVLEKDDIEVIAETSLIDYCYLNLIEYPDRSYESSKLYQYRIITNTESLIRLKKLLKYRRPKRLHIPGGANLENKICLYVAMKLGIEAVTYEIGEKAGKIVTTKNNHFWKFDSKELYLKYFNQYEKSLPDAYRVLEKRMEPRKFDDNIVAFQNTDVVDREKILEELKIGKEKKIALACTNVAWDAAALFMGRAFKSQIEWLIFLVEYFREKQNWQLIIRIHPGETLHKTNTRLGADLVKVYNNKLPENVKIIFPEDKINTYSIVKYAQIGFVFTSSIGMEMVMLGLPVITVGIVHYAELGFTYDPINKKDCEKTIDGLINNSLSVGEDWAKTAGVYFNIYHAEVYKDAVWNWRDFERYGKIANWEKCFNKSSSILDFLKND